MLLDLHSKVRPQRGQCLISYLWSAARTIGLNTKFLYYLLLSLLSLAIVVSLQAVGIILVIAMLITPGCIAYLLCHRFDRMLLIATLAAVLACLSGAYISFFINGATAACIVLMLGLEFFLAMVFAPKHGLLARRYRVEPMHRKEHIG